MQVPGEAAESARRLFIAIRWYRDVNLLRSNIDAAASGSNTIDLRSCFSFRFAMIFSL
jgi:hypothetical protein